MTTQSIKKFTYCDLNSKTHPNRFVVLPQSVSFESHDESKGEASSASIKMPRIAFANNDFSLTFGVLKQKGAFSSQSTFQTDERVISMGSVSMQLHSFFMMKSNKSDFATLLEKFENTVCVATETSLLYFDKRGRLFSKYSLPSTVDLLFQIVLVPSGNTFAENAAEDMLTFAITKEALYVFENQRQRIKFELSLESITGPGNNGSSLKYFAVNATSDFTCVALLLNQSNFIHFLCLSSQSHNYILIKHHKVDLFGDTPLRLAAVDPAATKCSFLLSTKNGYISSFDISLESAESGVSFRVPSIPESKRLHRSDPYATWLGANYNVLTPGAHQESQEKFAICTSEGGFFAFNSAVPPSIVISTSFDNDVVAEGAFISFLNGRILLAILQTSFGQIRGLQSKRSHQHSGTVESAQLELGSLDLNKAGYKHESEVSAKTVLDKLLGVNESLDKLGADDMLADNTSRRDGGRVAPWAVFKAASSAAAETGNEISPEKIVLQLQQQAKLVPLADVQSDALERELQRPALEKKVVELQDRVARLRNKVIAEQKQVAEANVRLSKTSHFNIPSTSITPKLVPKLKIKLERVFGEQSRAKCDLEIALEKLKGYKVGRIIIQTDFFCSVELDDSSTYKWMVAEPQEIAKLSNVLVPLTNTAIDRDRISLRLTPMQTGVYNEGSPAQSGVIEIVCFIVPFEDRGAFPAVGKLLYENIKQLVFYEPLPLQSKIDFDIDATGILTLDATDIDTAAVQLLLEECFYNVAPTKRALPFRIQEVTDFYVYKNTWYDFLLLVGYEEGSQKIVVASYDWNALEIVQSTFLKLSHIHGWTAPNFCLDFSNEIEKKGIRALLSGFYGLLASHVSLQMDRVWKNFKESYLEIANNDEFVKPFYDNLLKSSLAATELDKTSAISRKETVSLPSCKTPESLFLSPEWHVGDSRAVISPVPLQMLAFELASNLLVLYKYIGYEQSREHLQQIIDNYFAKVCLSARSFDFESFYNFFLPLFDP